MEQRKPALKISYVIGTYPDFSTTFIDREIRMLRQWGVDVCLLSIRQPVLRRALSQEQKANQREVIYLIPVRWLSFLGGHLRFMLTKSRTYMGTLLYLLTRPHPRTRDRWMTVLHFAEGVYAAHLLRTKAVSHLHAHFLDRAATVALVAGRLLGIPYSVAVHAGEDIYVHPVLLPEKLAEARFVVSCTQYNLDYLRQIGIQGLDSKAVAIHHGVDLERYVPAVRRHEPALLLSVGRLVEKKGFEYLIKACRRLKDQHREFVCRIIGPGPERLTLESLIDQLSLQDTVELCGAMPHEQVMEQYGQATLFVLPCIQGHDGSLDGIPNVLPEAMAAQVPVITTPVSAIPELVENEVNGILVPPQDDEALAEAMVRLLDDPLLCLRLGQEGRQTVSQRFHIERNVRAVYDLFMSRGGSDHGNR